MLCFHGIWLTASHSLSSTFCVSLVILPQLFHSSLFPVSVCLFALCCLSLSVSLKNVALFLPSFMLCPSFILSLAVFVLFPLTRPVSRAGIRCCVAFVFLHLFHAPYFQPPSSPNKNASVNILCIRIWAIKFLLPCLFGWQSTTLILNRTLSRTSINADKNAVAWCKKLHKPKIFFPESFTTCIWSVSHYNYFCQLLWNSHSLMTFPVYLLVYTQVVCQTLLQKIEILFLVIKDCDLLYLWLPVWSEHGDKRSPVQLHGVSFNEILITLYTKQR